LASSTVSDRVATISAQLTNTRTGEEWGCALVCEIGSVGSGDFYYPIIAAGKDLLGQDTAHAITFCDNLVASLSLPATCKPWHPISKREILPGADCLAGSPCIGDAFACTGETCVGPPNEPGGECVPCGPGNVGCQAFDNTACASQTSGTCTIPGICQPRQGCTYDGVGQGSCPDGGTCDLNNACPPPTTPTTTLPLGCCILHVAVSPCGTQGYCTAPGSDLATCQPYLTETGCGIFSACMRVKDPIPTTCADGTPAGADYTDYLTQVYYPPTDECASDPPCSF
jgi:hypothetical protein